ncbi:hypothetical protein MUS1_12475 [Marinomonas ushuaiensis DSM 15871]|uniref:Uncharacterized protein n=1 Tax=Marinomonas ushuaiensis DSM 15871 TaxID=1122207 RepID=X7E4I5_9GAMM|nr:hypothetical protein [Marinomonas ushuaiensis]ETX10785.1 hypothetical protein MUS1_12475 [Marinomonas ushuaiensis DSM 15871]
MKTESFIPSTEKNKSSKKATDYWSMLFVSLIFLSSISCFLFANHTDRAQANTLSDTTGKISMMKIDIDHSSKS